MKKYALKSKLSTCRDGRTLARIYDDYWDSMDIDLFSPRSPRTGRPEGIQGAGGTACKSQARLVRHRGRGLPLRQSCTPFPHSLAGICDISEPTGHSF